MNDTIMECQAMFFYFPMGDLNIQFQDVSWPNASTWAWDFGDGATSDEQNPVHQYAEAGAYNVSLTITVEETGCESTVTMDVWVEEGSGGDCQADFGYWNMEENTVQFENYSFAITPITEFAWDFGDGNTSDEESPVHQYAEEGTYDVTLAIVTEGGCESEVTYPVDVMNDTIMECQAMFFYFPMGDLNIQFQDISWPNASTWAWDFGDGATSDEQNPVHQYAEAGIYPVTLSIYVEETACESSITMEVAVDSTTFSNCFADFWYMQTGELSISFQDYSMPFPTTWAWDFGDGATSDEQNPVHEYAEGGEYQVTLTIYVEDINCESTVTYPVWVDDQNYMECFANFFWYYDPATPMSVSFENYSYSVTPIVEYAWDFGDGTTSAEENPVHQYNDYGVYTVTLAITTESGCSSDISFDVEVFDMGMYCQALFVPEIDEENPLLVHFNDLSIGNVTGWDWDFGDGETSNEQNPDHLYTEHDVYLVTLVIQTGDTCTSAFYCEIDLVNGQVVVSPGQTTGIVDHQAETPEITLYPNPVNNVLNINTGSNSDVEVQIINLAGQVMIKTTGRTVDVSSLPKGIYFARIFASGQSVTKKFIK
jgi:PKD repeat protein